MIKEFAERSAVSKYIQCCRNAREIEFSYHRDNVDNGELSRMVEKD